MFDRSPSLEALENDRWEDPAFTSSLVVTCHKLRRKAVGQLSPGELRVLVGQDIGLDYVVTLALEVLEADPLVEGDFFPGDLLKAVLLRDHAFWRSHPDLWARESDLASEVRLRSDSLLDDVLPTVDAFEQAR